jgi:quinol monooxygenase YgiN
MERAMNTINITARVLQGKGEEFLHAIQSLQQRLKQEEGFSKCTVYQDKTYESTFNLIEEWTTQDHLDGHLKSDLFRVLLGALKVLSAETEIRYRLVSDREGAKVLEIT